MKSVQVNVFYDTACVHMCGVCPSCVFAPKTPASTVWKASDEVKRKFVVALILRCGTVRELESIQRSLSLTSWTWFTYARSRSQSSSPLDSTYREISGKPPGIDVDKILKWFNSSTDWRRTSYLCRIFALCDFELLRLLCNLTSVLLVRQKREFQQFSVTDHNSNQDDEEDQEDPALTVVPGSSKSFSGVSKYMDFLSCLPVNLSKRILGLLDEQTLKCCKEVCWFWEHLAEETMQEIHLRRIFKDRKEAIMKSCCINVLSPTYARIVDVLVPINNDAEDVQPAVQKFKPFEDVYSKTKRVQMEERNIYCGAYFTEVLLNKENKQRALDYRGGSLMAVSTKNHLVHLLHVASGAKVAVMRGHVSVIRAVLLCEDRDLIITAGCDANIRCWNLKTGMCEVVLFGHTGTITCLDVHADKLVSGAKDFTVRVWSLVTWSRFKDFDFKHCSSVLCVKINKTFVCSSCDQGLVKIWNMENASLLRVINAHKSSVKCLFINDWYLLSGDSDGKVMAWSISCEAEESLMTFNHPKGVKSLTLLHLRVITGCLDRKIRIFNFLTGECLRDIGIEPASGRLLSLHFQDHIILVNTTSSVQLYQFAKVFWDYTEPTWRAVVAQQDSNPERTADSGRNFLSASIKKLNRSLPTQRAVDSNGSKPKRTEFLHQTCSLSAPTKRQTKSRGNSETTKWSVRSVKAEQMKKTAPHHPLT